MSKKVDEGAADIMVNRNIRYISARKIGTPKMRFSTTRSIRSEVVSDTRRWSRIVAAITCPMKP